MEEITKIAIFKGKGIRKTLYQNEWWFSVVDVVEVLTGTDRGRKYWNDLKKKIVAEGYSELSDKIGRLLFTSTLTSNCVLLRNILEIKK